jgi:hypothetical protein
MSFVAIAIGGGMALAAGATAYSASQTPDSPDYAAANREGVLADIETLPLRKLIERAAMMGQKVEYTDPKTGEKTTADFTGFGDIDKARAQMQYGAESSDKMAQLVLGLQEKYGSKYIEQRLKELEQSDPVGFALRKQMGESVSGELAQGFKLAPGMAEQVQQSERAAQAARGNLLGQSSGAAEAMQTGNAAYRLYQQRLANASAFLSGTTPTAQFGQISGAQQGAAPVMPQAIQQGISQNQNAGAMGYQAAQWGYQQQLENNPWMNFAGQVSGVGTGAASSGVNNLMLQQLLKQYQAG